MPFSFTREQDELRTVLRRYFDDSSPTSAVRRLMETEQGWDRQDWRDLHEQLGVGAVHVPEAYGGLGLGFVELGIVAEEMGRALVCSPFFASSVLATTAVLNAADETQKTRLLPKLANGETVATLACAEASGRWDGDGVEATATPSGAGYRLNGVKSFVLDGASSDLFIVLARTPGSQGAAGLSLFTVAAGAPGLAVQRLASLDPTRKLARLTFDDVEAELLGEFEGAAEPFARTLAQACAMLANEMVGGAERLRESALEYAGLRMQFGRPISSFQSMKHKQADMLLEVELAKSAAYYAAAAADERAADFPAVAHLAKATASDTYLQTAIHTIQIHGGMGFTWDNDTHLWFKRAKSSEAFLGDAAWHRERMIRTWSA